MAEVKQNPAPVNITVSPPGDPLILDVDFPFAIDGYAFEAKLTLADLTTIITPTQVISLPDKRLTLTFPGTVKGVHSWYLKLTPPDEPQRTWFSGPYTVKA